MKILLVLGIYLICMIGVTLIYKRETKTVTYFNVAGRNLGGFVSALSVAATWIWAPALFTSAEQAYTHGIAGLFWFLIPNIVCLLIFAPFAFHLRKQFPNGITLSSFMRNKYSGRVRNLYLFQMSALSVLSTAVQLLAGGKVLAIMTGLPYPAMIIMLACVGIGCSVFSGIKGSVITDAIQFVIILATAAGLVGGLIYIHGTSSLTSGLGGISGSFRSLFDKNGIDVFLNFGLSSAIGLMSGPFGDQSFWQRAFSVKQKSVKSTFIIGSLCFGAVPLLIGLIGFIGAGSGYVSADTGNITFHIISDNFPSWVLIPFTVMILSGLLSTVDSNMCALSSLSTDIWGLESLSKGRVCIVISSVLSILIALIPGITVTHLFLFYGTLRASTLLPTILTIKNVRISEKGVYYGIMTSICIGLPVFFFFFIFDVTGLKILGSIISVAASGIISLLCRRTEAAKI